MGTCASNQTDNKLMINKPACIIWHHSQNCYALVTLENAIDIYKVTIPNLKELYNNNNITCYENAKQLYTRVVFIRPSDKATITYNHDFYPARAEIRLNGVIHDVSSLKMDFLFKICQPPQDQRIIYPKKQLCIIDNIVYTTTDANAILSKKGLNLDQMFSAADTFSTVLSDKTRLNCNLIRNFDDCYIHVTNKDSTDIVIYFNNNNTKYKAKATKYTLDALENPVRTLD
jgi:hypothetical protein